MTPLAHAIVADSTLPVKKRQYDDAARHLRLLDGVHFFACEAVWPTALDLANAPAERIIALSDGPLAFLPTPRTWLEVGNPYALGKTAFLLEQVGNDAVVTIVVDRVDGMVATQIMRLPLSGSSAPSGEYYVTYEGFSGLGFGRVIYALLAMINTPRVIGRRQHMPHAGLQRKLAAARSMVGKYPLQAWHELVLEVTPPRVADEEPHETRLTGSKAQHFVRCHLRVRLGGLELVSSHWRGDPALGIKQTRYRVVPPRTAA